MLIPTAFIADKSKKKKVTPVSKEEQAKAFDILKRQTEKEKASEQGFIQDQLIAQDEAIQRQRAGLNTPKPKSYTEITVPTPAIPVAPTVKTTPEGLVKKTFNTKYGVVDYVADERESKIFKGTDVNAINNLTKDIVQYFEGLGRDQGRKPIVKNTREKYTFDEVNAALNPNFVEEETRKGVKQFEDATLGKLDVLGVRTRLNELADYAKQSDSTLGQVAGGFVEAVANPMTTFAMSTGNIIDPNATLEERGGAVANLALAAIPIGQFAGAATAGASAFKQGLSSGLRNAIKVGAREYAKDTLFGNLALREITLDSVVRQLRNAGEVEGNVLRFKNDLRKEAKRSGVNPSDYLKNKFQEAEVAVEPSIPSSTSASTSTQTSSQPPTTVVPEPTVRTDFDWSNIANENDVRKAWFDFYKKAAPNRSDDIILGYVDQKIEKFKADPTLNPYLRRDTQTYNNKFFDIRTGKELPSEYFEAPATPTTSAIPEPPVVPTVELSVAPTPMQSPAVQPPVPVVPEVMVKTDFDWSNSVNEQAVRDAWFDFFRKAAPNRTNDEILNFVNQKVEKFKADSTLNPYARNGGDGKFYDVRTRQQLPSQYFEAPTTGNSAIDEAFKVEQEITGQVTPPAQESIIDINSTTRERYNAIADEDDAWLEQYYARKMNTRQAGFELEDYEAMARMARSFAIKYGYNNFDDALQLVARTLKERTGIDIAFTNADRQAIKDSIDRLEGKSTVATEPPVSSAMQAEQPPVPPTQTATTAISEPGNVPIEVGISNKANLSAQELELISQAPQGKGRSASKVVEDVIQRNPADEELNILAGKVANGEALNAEQTAMLLVGQGRFNLKVFNARESLDNAIKSGASAQDIDQLRDAWLLAQADATNFAKQIQKGKSGWSDVGRVLQQKTDLFTGELSQIKANIIAEAELRKGRKLTNAEQENYKTMVDKLIGENKKLEEELAKLKATRNEATQEGRVRRTRTSASLDKLIAKKENTIRVNKATVTQKLNSEIPVATSTKIGQVITNMKLLNPFSRFTDIESNAIKLLDNIATTPINMAVDQATSRILKSEPLYSSSYLASDRAKNLVTNAWEKMKADAKIVMAGGDVETIEKFGGNAGLGSKAAGLTDVPFKAVYHEDGKFIAADVKARESLKEELGAGNFGKKDIEARRAEILNNIEEHPDVIMNAEEYALNETFNNQNWASKINKALKGTVFKSPTAQLTYDELIGRFTKVITNVAIDVADRTGLGVARGVYNIADAIKSGKNLTVAERMAINKMITKGMIGMPLMYLGIKNWDKIEGEIRGVQQKYIDYGDLGKLGGPIAIFLHGASIGRAMNELPEDKVNDFVLASSFKLPLNTPFVSNVAEISDVLDNPAPKAIAKLLAKKASNTLIPAMVREIAMRMDTEKGFQTGMEPEREKYPKGSGAFDIVKGEFQSKIPGLRQQLPLKNQKVGRPDE
jgi:ubiquitin